MKKVFVVASLSLLALTACKKDFTCTCSKSGTGPTTFDVDNVKKSDAQDACNKVGAAYVSQGYTCTTEKK